MPPRSRKHPELTLRGRIWIELGSRPALTEAGADLLEQIAISGSLSAAARRLRFSYRRAWMLAESMNRLWPKPLIKLSTGGRHGGGATLTDLGQRVLSSYRDLQVQIEAALGDATAHFRRSTES